MKNTQSRISSFELRQRAVWLLLFVAALFTIAAFVKAPFARAQQTASMTTSSGGAAKAAAKLTYPEAKRVEQVDNYFGTDGDRIATNTKLS